MEDLILRDYIISAASEINAGGGSNQDNPTNLGVSDFSLVAATLDTNNALSDVGVVKPVIIDLEAHRKVEGDRGQAVERRAA